MIPTIVSTTLRSQLLAALMLLSATTVTRATEAIVLPAKGDACKTLRGESEFNLWQCRGPAGYAFSYADAVMQGGLTFGLENSLNQSSPEDIHWAPAHEGIGSRIEWRMSNGKPYAAIIGRWRHLDEAQTETVLEELLVVKVLPHDGCEVGTIGAFTPDAMAAARRLADTRAPTFRCRVDKPAMPSDAANGSIGKLDRQFGPAEMLDHNGSLVALTRAPDGSIEIRYQQPRATLPVLHGATLFRGQEKAGLVSGTAFVFKQGCEPAGYQVTGKRDDGVLVLEGAAPHRDPHSCAIIAARSASKHSRLVFYHEPVTDEHLAGTAPMTIAQCGKCMPATVKTIEGVGTSSAHIEAEITTDDVRDYCENWTSGSDRMPACVAENAAEIGKTQRAAADCSDLTVQPSAGGHYRFLKVAEDSGERLPIWQNIATGQVECNANSCNGRVATAHFSLLCPGVIPGWSGYHY